MAYEDEELNKRRSQRAEEKKRMQQQLKLLKIGAIVTAVTMVLCATALLITYGVVNLPQQGPASLGSSTTQLPSTTESEPVQTLPPEPDTVIHFVAGGDVNVTEKIVGAGTTTSGYDYTNVFMDLVPVLGSADLTAVNFEGSLFGAPYGQANKSAPQQLMQALADAGVDFIQAANSQSIANGLTGLNRTLQGIRSAGMEPLGAYATPEEFHKDGGYILREVKGVKIAIVAFTKGMNGMGLPAGSEDCVNLLYQDYNSTYKKVDTDGITRILRSVQSQKPDVTIALLHWGSEYNNQINATQEKIRDLMLREGVDAILGTHSHYVQSVEFDEKQGTLVAYSMGDLLGDGDKAGTDYSVLLDLQITRDGTTGKCSITGFEYTPVYIHNETETGGGIRLLRIREAMTAYEQNSIGKVSDEVYAAMKSALEKIEARMNPEA